MSVRSKKAKKIPEKKYVGKWVKNVGTLVKSGSRMGSKMSENLPEYKNVRKWEQNGRKFPREENLRNEFNNVRKFP